MSWPQVSDNDFPERTGVIEVARVVNAARCIWRETPLRDVGIDGQIEYVAPGGNVTARLVGVQVKSGASYFQAEQDGAILYRPTDRHAAYWAAWSLPVILVLHDPARGVTVWTDARMALRMGQNPIRVPLRQTFDEAGVLAALECAGPLPSGNEDLEGILQQMVATKTRDPGFDMSFLDLFAQGMTDVAYSVYFNMDLVMAIAEANAALSGWEYGIGIGHGEHAFIDAYVGFLVANDLARVDYDAWRQAEVERQMTASFIAPLTAKGRALVALISRTDSELLGKPEMWQRPIEERPVQLLPLRMLERTERLRDFKAALEERAASRRSDDTTPTGDSSVSTKRTDLRTLDSRASAWRGASGMYRFAREAGAGDRAARSIASRPTRKRGRRHFDPHPSATSPREFGSRVPRIYGARTDREAAAAQRVNMRTRASAPGSGVACR